VGVYPVALKEPSPKKSIGPEAGRGRGVATVGGCGSGPVVDFFRFGRDFGNFRGNPGRKEKVG